uniref:Uncharacterized protein n=1 Tax=Wuchereria bancrofti TaxID=6293 RepID=A0AAF5PXA8_WUCBA
MKGVIFFLFIYNCFILYKILNSKLK